MTGSARGMNKFRQEALRLQTIRDIIERKTKRIEIGTELCKLFNIIGPAAQDLTWTGPEGQRHIVKDEASGYYFDIVRKIVNLQHEYDQL